MTALDKLADEIVNHGARTFCLDRNYVLERLGVAFELGRADALDRPRDPEKIHQVGGDSERGRVWETER